MYRQADERKVERELLFGALSAGFSSGTIRRRWRGGAAATASRDVEDAVLASQADTEAWHGKLRNASELTRRAMKSAERNDAKETAAAYQAAAALREVELGNPDQALADANAAVKLAPNRDVRAMAGLALARAGDTTTAEKLMAELDKTFPLDTMVQRYWLPTIGAAVALSVKIQAGRSNSCKRRAPIELGQAANLTIFFCARSICEEKLISCCAMARLRLRNFRSSSTTADW